MNPSKTITINIDGRQNPVDIRLLYCLGAEAGFTNETGKTIDIFFPHTAKGEDGKDIMIPPIANDYDCCRLIMSCIIAASEEEAERTHQQPKPPVNSHDLLYRISREDTQKLVSALYDLMMEWHNIPKAIKPEMKPDDREGDEKNASEPTNSTKNS